MAKELPYFKFEPSEWDNGNIQMCSFETQGVFINLCSMYWHRLGELPYKLALQKICKGEAKLIDKLVEENIIAIEDDKVVISFLDEQLQEFSEVREKRVEAGKKGGKNRSLRPDIERMQGRQFYVIYCFNEVEEFIKFGITDDSISRRFSGKMPYEYRTLFQFSTNENLSIESECDNVLRQFRYSPKKEFPGYLECYSIAVLGQLGDILKQRTGIALASLNRRNAIRGEKIREDKTSKGDWEIWGKSIVADNDQYWHNMRGRKITQQEMDEFLSVATRNDWKMDTQQQFRTSLKGFKSNKPATQPTTTNGSTVTISDQPRKVHA